MLVHITRPTLETVSCLRAHLQIEQSGSGIQKRGVCVVSSAMTNRIESPSLQMASYLRSLEAPRSTSGSYRTVKRISDSMVILLWSMIWRSLRIAGS